MSSGCGTGGSSEWRSVCRREHWQQAEQRDRPTGPWQVSHHKVQLHGLLGPPTYLPGLGHATVAESTGKYFAGRKQHCRVVPRSPQAMLLGCTQQLAEGRLGDSRQVKGMAQANRRGFEGAKRARSPQRPLIKTRASARKGIREHIQGPQRHPLLEWGQLVPNGGGHHISTGTGMQQIGGLR